MLVPKNAGKSAVSEDKVKKAYEGKPAVEQ